MLASKSNNFIGLMMNKILILIS